MKNLVSQARKKRTLNEAFHNEAGAIDLASIMVGIIVIGLIGGVIAATVFAVIPWSQDNAARDQLSRVVQAVHSATAVNGGNYTADVGSYIDIQSVGATVISNNPGCYGAFLKSSSGRYYYASNQSSNPTAVPSPWPNTKPANYPANCNWPSSGENVGQPMASYTNIFANPSFRNGTARVTANTSLTYAVDNSGDGNTLVATRVNAAPSRLELAAPMAANTSYTFIATLQSNVDEEIEISYRPSTWNTNGVIIDRVNLTANTPRTVVIPGVTIAEAPSSAAGVTLISRNTAIPLGSTLKVDNVAVIANASADKPYTGGYFDGATPGASWTGAADASASTIVK